MDVSLLLMGIVVGVFIGLIGMGGAALMTPFPILSMAVRPVVAVGTDLAHCAGTKLVGALMHWRQGTVDMRLALRLGLGSIPGGLLGLQMVGQLQRSELNADVC